MQIFIGADYRGLERKNQLMEYLLRNAYSVTDLGDFEYNEGGDFNDSAVNVALKVRETPGSIGILICDSAHGMTIQANRFKKIRATNCDSIESARLARKHDDANVLVMSAHFVDENKMQEIAETFIHTNFEKLERRVRRINRLDEREDYD